MPEDARLPRRPNVEIVRCVPDLAAELRSAAASVSQCGYNTALDIVRAGVPALVVPVRDAEEDEQTRRARRLEPLGVLQVGTLADLDLAALLAFRPAAATLDLDGAARDYGAARRMNVLRPYVLRHWPALAGAGGATLVLSAAELAKPWPLALVVDHLLERQARLTGCWPPSRR